MTITEIPKPQKPWETSSKDKRTTALLMLSSILVASALVKFWVFNGKLGFFIALFVSSQVIFFTHSYRKLGSPAAKDTLLKGFALMGITLTLMPIVSIISTVVFKGYKGLHPTLLFKDMALASVNDPIANGGLLHALVGTIIMVSGALIISFPIGVLTALYLTEI